MAGPNSFEALLDRPIRWPTKGDRLFVASKDPMDDAILSRPTLSRGFVMAESYRRAADELVESVTTDRAPRDLLVFPIIFCYRHFIELSLKALLATYGRQVDIASNWRDHDIAALWLQFRKMLDLYEIEDEDEGTGAVGACVAEFAKIDPHSFTFRYPVDTKGRPIDVGLERLDLDQLRDVMTSLDVYFSGTDGYLDHLVKSGPNFEGDY